MERLPTSLATIKVVIAGYLASQVVAQLLHVSHLVAQILIVSTALIVHSAAEQKHSASKFDTSGSTDNDETLHSTKGKDKAKPCPLKTRSTSSPVRTVPTVGAFSSQHPPSSKISVDSSLADYADKVGSIRQQECPQLADACYLDAAASPPYPSGLVHQVAQDLATHLYSNPHSKSPSSVQTDDKIDRIRMRIMRELFGIQHVQDWYLIFTSGTTASLKLVGECFDWQRCGDFYHLLQSHTSVLGMRELAAQAGAKTSIFSQHQYPSHPSTYKKSDLVAFPLQCNATGKKYFDLLLHPSAPSRYTLVDAASYLSSSQTLSLGDLDLEQCPDFVAFSFYKIFGYPTGLGGLLVKKVSAGALSRKRFYGGGAVDSIVAETPWRIPRKDLTAAMEDGTVHIHGILAVRHALDYFDQHLGAWKQRRQYVRHLTAHLFTGMSRLRHTNGQPVVRIYTDSNEARYWMSAEREQDPERERLQEQGTDPSDDQGPILNFNLFNSEGKPIPPIEVDRLAAITNIHIRSGRHCNPGFVSSQLSLLPQAIQDEYHQGISCDESTDSEHSLSTSLRISLSILSTIDDIQRLVEFVQRFFVHTASPIPIPNPSSSEASTKDSMVPLSSSTLPDPSTVNFTLEQITLYPIKSCGGQSLSSDESWKLTRHGLEFDREWIIVDLRTGSILSQKKYPKMVLIRPRIDLLDRQLVISIPSSSSSTSTTDEKTITLSLDFYPTSSSSLTTLCSDSLELNLYQDPTLQTLLSNHLGIPCTLARQPSSSSSSSFSTRHSKLSPPSSSTPIPLLFSNESPYLFITQSSLFQLSKWSCQLIDSFSFRSNFLLSSSSSSNDDAFIEDRICSITISNTLHFAVLGNCRRCQMICVDSKTSQIHHHVFKTLAKYRRNEKGRILFGCHLTWLNPILSSSSDSSSSNTIQVGMKVTAKLSSPHSEF